MNDFSQQTDADLHDRLQAIHDEIQQTLPARARSDEKFTALFSNSDVPEWQRKQASLEEERERIRSELRRRDEKEQQT